MTSFGEMLRQWRQHRHLSQLDLSLETGTSARHLSFIETGRSRPSRLMVLTLGRTLDVPLREQNAMLLAAGYAPVYPERGLDDPALAPARRAIDLVLAGHEPYPAIAIDRHWHLVAQNRAVGLLLAGVKEPRLLEPPVNVIRLSIHEGGLAPHILNLAEWRGHLVERLERQVRSTADPKISELLDEVRRDGVEADPHELSVTDFVVPLRIRTPAGDLSFISSTTVFGTPMDVTLAELAIETFLPADEATAASLRAAMEYGGS